jgi:hypothetical protein
MRQSFEYMCWIRYCPLMLSRQYAAGGVLGYQVGTMKSTWYTFPQSVRRLTTNAATTSFAEKTARIRPWSSKACFGASLLKWLNLLLTS